PLGRLRPRDRDPPRLADLGLDGRRENLAGRKRPGRGAGAARSTTTRSAATRGGRSDCPAWSGTPATARYFLINRLTKLLAGAARADVRREPLDERTQLPPPLAHALGRPACVQPRPAPDVADGDERAVAEQVDPRVVGLVAARRRLERVSDHLEFAEPAED